MVEVHARVHGAVGIQDCSSHGVHPVAAFGRIGGRVDSLPGPLNEFFFSIGKFAIVQLVRCGVHRSSLAANSRNQLSHAPSASPASTSHPAARGCAPSSAATSLRHTSLPANCSWTLK